MKGTGSVFKFLRCTCGSQLRCKEIQRKAPPCPKCGGAAAYSDFWYIAYCDHRGKEVKEAVSIFKDQAQDQLKRVQAALVDGKYSDKKSEITWENALKEFEKYKSASVKPDTVGFYMTHLAMLTPTFKHLKLHEIGANNATNYINTRAKVVSNGTINHDIVSLKVLLNVFAKGFITDPKGNKYIEVNPLANYGKLQGNDERTEAFTPQEVDLLLERAQHLAIKPFVLLGTDAGLRKRTILTLEKEFINWELNRLEIPASRRKRGRYIHYVLLTKRLKENLQVWLNSQTDTEKASKYVFPAPEDPSKYFYSIEKPWRKTLKACNIQNKTFHDTKHTAGTRFYEATEDIYAVANFLDHADINMSRKYAHQFDKKRQESMRKFEEVINSRDEICDETRKAA